MELNFIIANVIFFILGILVGMYIEYRKSMKDIVNDLNQLIQLYKELNKLKDENIILKKRLDINSKI